MQVRIVPALVFGLLLVAASAFAVDEMVITVRTSDWDHTDLTVKRGQIVTWKWESGTHTIMIGEGPEDPARVLLGVVDRDHPTLTWEAKEANKKFHFYSAAHPEIKATITVQNATGVDNTTWGYLKHLFERPATR